MRDPKRDDPDSWVSLIDGADNGFNYNCGWAGTVLGETAQRDAETLRDAEATTRWAMYMMYNKRMRGARTSPAKME